LKIIILLVSKNAIIAGRSGARHEIDNIMSLLKLTLFIELQLNVKIIKNLFPKGELLSFMEK